MRVHHHILHAAVVGDVRQFYAAEKSDTVGLQARAVDDARVLKHLLLEAYLS